MRPSYNVYYYCRAFMFIFVLISSTIISTTKSDQNLREKNQKMENSAPSSSSSVSVQEEQVIHVFKKYLLTKMGLRDRPSLQLVKNRPSGATIDVPDILKSIYKHKVENDESSDEILEELIDDHTIQDAILKDRNWDTARAFIAENITSEASSSSSLWSKKTVLTFNLSTFSPDEEIEGAQLALLLIRSSSHNTNDDNQGDGDSITDINDEEPCYLRITISEHVRNHTVTLDTHQADCSVHKRRQIGRRQWLTFDVARALRHYLLQMPAAAAFSISVETRSHSQRPACDLNFSTSTTRDSPTLIVYTAVKSRKRRHASSSSHQKRQHHKNAAGRSQKNKNQLQPQPCGRREMRIDFDAVGWNDWIVAPKYYDAYYCDGHCRWPLSADMNATNHGIVQSLLHSVNPAAVPSPNCAPTDLGAISMLYVDENKKIVLKNYEGMVVLGCGCK